MPRIFISYRRADTQHVTDRLFDTLELQFGEGNVFQDVDRIPIGVNFVEHIRSEIAKADVVLVVIGPDWARILRERESEANDFVRIEVEQALALNKHVIPVTVKHARMPGERDVPESVRPLCVINAAQVRPNPDWKRDSRALTEGIRAIVTQRNADPHPPAPSPSGRGGGKQPGVAPAPADPHPPAQPTPPRTQGREKKQAKPPAQTKVVSPRPEGEGPGVRAVTRNDDWTPEIHTFTVHGIDFAMCLVPPGSFMMGSEDGHDDEKPVHRQTITEPYWIGVHPVTNAQWRAAVAASGGAVKAPDWVDWYNDRKKANHPVVGVTWHQCRAFVQWLGDVWNLPTEIQWEYAARGPDALIYPWGNEFQPDLLVYRDNSDGSIPTIGGRPDGASWVGAQDMAGNVWEWTLTKWRDDYTTPPDDNVDGNSRRVVRGGSFLNESSLARAAVRGGADPFVRLYDQGFRVLRRPPSY